MPASDIKEDAPVNNAGGAPVNNAGGGNIAGIGVGPDGEPGVSRPKRRKYKRKNETEEDQVTADVALLKRKTPMMEETGTFAGNKTFIVNDDMFAKARIAKRKGQHWRTYLGGDEFESIREYANKNKKSPIILQNKSGTMMFARYGAKK